MEALDPESLRREARVIDGNQFVVCFLKLVRYEELAILGKMGEEQLDISLLHPKEAVKPELVTSLILARSPDIDVKSLYSSSVTDDVDSVIDASTVMTASSSKPVSRVPSRRGSFGGGSVVTLTRSVSRLNRSVGCQADSKRAVTAPATAGKEGSRKSLVVEGGNSVSSTRKSSMLTSLCNGVNIWDPIDGTLGRNQSTKF